ncbi:hypothetical protein [Altererythrobacter xiamenensis]|nr:hypothetical protein [Altererythrobacter xiamenensis]
MKRAMLPPAAALTMLVACGESSPDTLTETEQSAESTIADGDARVSTSTPDQGPANRNSGGETDFDKDMAYYFSQGERGATLSFGVPQTDNIALNLRCPLGAGGKSVLVYFTRPGRIVAKRPATIDLRAGEAEQQLPIETRETQLGTTVEVETAVSTPVMQQYRTGQPLDVFYGEEKVTIPSRSSDREIQQFFNACAA